MANGNSTDERAERIERIREIVREDFDRVQKAASPFEVLNLQEGVDIEEVRDRYQRYERFYRAENFQRLGNMDLTRKALDVRRAIGKAMGEIQQCLEALKEDDQPTQAFQPDLDPDDAAMANIYFRDGLTYLRLGDFHGALNYLQLAHEFHPSRGIVLAHLAYTRFKLSPTNPKIVDAVSQQLRDAVELEPKNGEIYAILARFRINTSDQSGAHQALEMLESYAPNHPLLSSLKKRAKY